MRQIEADAHVGDIGTLITLDLGQDITMSTVKEIHYQKPGLNPVTGIWIAYVVETTKLQYKTLVTDLTINGTWELQAYVDLPDWQGRGFITEFEVGRKILSRV